jgi:long-chain acyl-CoA synthetase
MGARGATLCERFADRTRTSAGRPAAWVRQGAGWRTITWGEVGQVGEAFGVGLHALGHGRGEPVAVLAETRPEWMMIDLGAFGIGAPVVGVYPTLAPEQAAYVIDHSDATTLVVQGPAHLDRALAVPESLRKVARIVALEEVDRARDARIVSFDHVVGEGEAALALEEGRFARLASAVRPEDCALIIYTSGTTGPPKGAMLSHANICFVMDYGERWLPISEDDVSFAFLPMAHVAEHVVGMLGRVQVGFGAYYARSVATVLEDVAAARPTLFGSVPRVFEKAHAAVMARIEGASGLRRAAGRWGVATGLRAARLRREGRPLPAALRLGLPVADRLVLAKVRAAFGGRVRMFVSGAAPIALEILEFFDACGMPIYEVYGMTESTGIITANRPGATRLGTVGRPIEGVEVRIASDGEILSRGPNTFLGYLKDEVATKETVDDEGWLHTGDIGELDADGFLRITDRKKELIITAGGKNISPANVETLLKQHPLVGQACVVGDRRPYLVALVVLDPEAAATWARERGLAAASLAEIAAHPALRAEIQRAVDEANRRLARVESVRKFAVLPSEWTVEGGELTPTLKLKRRVILEKHRDVIEEMYRS